MIDLPPIVKASAWLPVSAEMLEDADDARRLWAAIRRAAATPGTPTCGPSPTASASSATAWSPRWPGDRPPPLRPHGGRLWAPRYRAGHPLLRRLTSTAPGRPSPGAVARMGIVDPGWTGHAVLDSRATVLAALGPTGDVCTCGAPPGARR